MIDINELRDRAATFGSDYLTDEEWVEVINRLEAAEKDVALKERVIDALGSELNAVANEHDALRAKIEQMEQQEPAYWGPKHAIEGGSTTVIVGKFPVNPTDVPLYALPGAQPQLNEIKINLQRALELGQRETWTGARKHRSREDQREEQQCWNKVWSLLGAKGE